MLPAFGDGEQLIADEGWPVSVGDFVVVWLRGVPTPVCKQLMTSLPPMREWRTGRLEIVIDALNEPGREVRFETRLLEAVHRVRGPCVLIPEVPADVSDAIEGQTEEAVRGMIEAGIGDAERDHLISSFVEPMRRALNTPQNETSDEDRRNFAAGMRFALPWLLD